MFFSTEELWRYNQWIETEFIENCVEVETSYEQFFAILVFRLKLRRITIFFTSGIVLSRLSFLHLRTRGKIYLVEMGGGANEEL